MVKEPLQIQCKYLVYIITDFAIKITTEQLQELQQADPFEEG